MLYKPIKQNALDTTSQTKQNIYIILSVCSPLLWV